MLGALFEQEQEEDFSMFVDDGVAPTDTTELKGKKKMEKPADPRDPLGFVGLQNQGATCYLNSLIQVMYMTPELRDGLYKVDPLELGVAHIEEHEKEKATLEKKGSVEPDDNMMETLLAMGVPEASARYALIKTKNKGIEDAFECIMELGDNPPPAEEAPKKKKKPRYVPLELQRLFSELQMIDKAAISTEDLTSKGFNWQSFDGRVQHDAHELNRLLVDALEKSLKKTSGDALCKTLYEGTMVNQILCTKCHRISEREESFYDLNMQVVDCSDVAQALHNFCKKEVLDGDSAYACETCRCKTRALRCSKLVRLPNILTFSCNRFKIDRSTNWQRVKVTSASDYPLALNMNPFVYGYALQDASMDDDDQSDTHMVSIAHNSMVWMDSLKAEAEGFLETCLASSGKALDDFQWSTQQIDHFRRKVVQRIEEQDPCMHPKVEDNYRYSLHAIIIHRGSAYSGHYYAYIRDNLHEASYLPTDPNAFKEPSANVDKNTSKKNASSQKKTSDAGTQMDVDASASSSSAASNAPTAAAAADIDIKDDYLFDEVTQNTFVRQDSLIHKILFVFEEEQTTFIKSMHKRRLSARKDKPFFLKGSAIARGMATHFQEPWAKLYKARHGSVDDFLQRHKTLFVETEPSEFSLQPDLVTSIIPDEAFRSLYISKQPVYLPKLTAVIPSNTPHSSGGVDDDDTAMDVDSDEALAKALQDSLNREANGGRSTRALSSGNAQESTASAWQTAGKKRKGHKDTAASASQAGTTDTVTIVAEGTAQEQEDTARWVRQNLVEDLLRYTAGLFLEFNDSRVSQITYDTLQRAFKGVDSAYLIVYRRVRTFQDIFPQQLYTKTATTSPVLPALLSPVLAKTAPVAAVAPLMKSVRPVPPPYWADKIRGVNEALAVRRAEYHEQSQQRLVSVYFQSSVHYYNPCFLVHAAAGSSTAKASVNTPCVHVEMDTRKTVQDLLLALFQPHLASYTDGDAALTTAAVPSSGNVDLTTTTATTATKNVPTIMGSPAAHQRLLKEFLHKYAESLAVSSSTAGTATLTEAQLAHILSQVAVSRLEPVVALTQQGNVADATKAYQHAYYASTPAEALTTSVGDFANRADAAVLRRLGNHCRLLIWLPSTAAAQGIVYGDRSRPVPIKTWVLDSPYQRQQQQLQQQSKTTGSSWGKGKSATAVSTTTTATAMTSVKKGNGSSSNAHDPNDIVVSNAVQLYYVPGHLTVFDTVLFLAGKYGLDAMRYMVRARVPDVAAATAAATATYSARTTRAATKAASTSDHSKVATIFDQGIVSLAPALQLLGHTVGGGSSGGSTAFHETTPIAELWFVRELYLEDYTAQGFHPTSLAERFLSMQLHMITVTVELDSSVIKVVQKQQQQQQQQQQQSENAADVPDSVDLEVFKTATIAMLKEKLLTGYGLLSTTTTTATGSSNAVDGEGISLETCRLRLGTQPGESVLDDETQTLEAAGIRSHMRLYLETGSHMRPRDTVIVNVLLVHGNSTQMKYTASEAGWRVGDPALLSDAAGQAHAGEPQPLTIEVPLSVTVRELRDMVGMRMLQFPPRWTEMEPALWVNQTAAATVADPPAHTAAPSSSAAPVARKDDGSSTAASEATATVAEWTESLRHHAYYQHHEYRGRRLRRTSWMGEFAELLLETDKKTNAMTLKDADVKDGELLLLEEGRLPVRGMHDIAVYFWHDRPLLEVIDVDAPAAMEAGAGPGAGRAAGAIVRPPVPPSAMDVDPPATAAATATSVDGGGRDGDRDVVVIDDDDNEQGGALPSIAEQAAVAQRQRMACVHRLGEVQVSVNGNLGEMHQLVTRLVQRSREVLLQRMSASLPVTALLAAEAVRQEQPGRLEALLQQCTPADRALWEHMVNPEEYLLLREMRPDTLPGKCLWMVDSNNNQSAAATASAASAAASAATTTPVKGGTKAATAAATTPSTTTDATAAAPPTTTTTPHPFGHSHLGHTPIKKLSIKAERGLIVQLLPRPQPLERSSAGSIRIWVQRLLNPQHAAEGRAQLSPSWPPIAATLQGGIAPTLGHLHRAIMTAMPGIVTTPDQLVVYKYNLARFVWEEMKHDGGSSSSSSGGGSGGGKKKAENLFQAPYNVKEGTLFCAFSKLDLMTSAAAAAASTSSSVSSSSSSSSSSKTLATISTAMDISLPLDIFMQQLKAEVALHKKQGRHVVGGGGAGGPGGSGSGSARNDVLKKPEYALTLHLDLDDWDDE